MKLPYRDAIHRVRGFPQNVGYCRRLLDNFGRHVWRPYEMVVDMTCKNRAVIISGGTIRDYSHIKQLIRETDFVICADSGYDHALKMGISSNLVVGDFDSARMCHLKKKCLSGYCYAELAAVSEIFDIG